MLDRPQQRDAMVTLAATMLFAASQVYLIPKVVDVSIGLDFRLIWLAGELWLSGENPHGEAFRAAYLEVFGPGPASHFWVYPPYWYPISVFLGLFPFELALNIWNSANLYFIYVASALLALVIPGKADNLTKFLLIASSASLMQATPFSLSIGQTSLLIFLGSALFVLGFMRGNRLLVGVAIGLLMLKPQVGLVFVAVCLPHLRLWPSVIAPAILLSFAMVPALVSGGFHATATGFLAGLAAYNSPEAIASLPQHLVGLSQILHVAGVSLPSFIYLAAGYFLTFSAAFLINDSRLVLFVAVASSIFFTGLHVYDLTILLALVPVVLGLGATAKMALLTTMVLCFRPANLAEMAGVIVSDIFPGSFLASVGLSLLAATAVALVCIKQSATPDFSPAEVHRDLK